MIYIYALNLLIVIACTSSSTTQNFTKKIKNIFCINVFKNAKEKVSLGFWVTKIKTDTAGARFPNS